MKLSDAIKLRDQLTAAINDAYAADSGDVMLSTAALAAQLDNTARAELQTAIDEALGD